MTKLKSSPTPRSVPRLLPSFCTWCQPLFSSLPRPRTSGLLQLSSHLHSVACVCSTPLSGLESTLCLPFHSRSNPHELAFGLFIHWVEFPGARPWTHGGGWRGWKDRVGCRKGLCVMRGRALRRTRLYLRAPVYSNCLYFYMFLVATSLGLSSA